MKTVYETECTIGEVETGGSRKLVVIGAYVSAENGTYQGVLVMRRKGERAERIIFEKLDFEEAKRAADKHVQMLAYQRPGSSSSRIPE